MLTAGGCRLTTLLAAGQGVLFERRTEHDTAAIAAIAIFIPLPAWPPGNPHLVPNIQVSRRLYLPIEIWQALGYLREQ